MKRVQQVRQGQVSTREAHELELRLRRLRAGKVRPPPERLTPGERATAEASLEVTK